VTQREFPEHDAIHGLAQAPSARSPNPRFTNGHAYPISLSSAVQLSFQESEQRGSSPVAHPLRLLPATV